jgi:hypothetical protein
VTTQNALVAQAAADAVGIALHYAQRQKSLVSVAMGGEARCVELAHYPRNDVVDAEQATRFYYHAHGSRKCPKAEHGHFHLFKHTGQKGDFMHLAGLSLDAQGLPIRWFTTNCWVTGERWRGADEVIESLRTYEIRVQGERAPLAKWLTAMVQLFRPQLEQLLRRRDRIMARHLARGDLAMVSEDRSLDVLSQCSAALAPRIRQFQQRGY